METGCLPEASVALVKGNIADYAVKFNQALIRDYDDLDYYDALYLKLPNGTPFELQRYDGFEDGIFHIYIPPALEDYEALLKSILDVLEIDDNQVSLYLDHYEKVYGITVWNEHLKAKHERNKDKNDAHPMIAFLHTSPVHIPRFDTLVRQYNKTISVKHVVNQDLLKVAIKTGHIDAVGFEKAIKDIKASNPVLIICTCSTYGTLCDSLTNVHRIDQPIADYLVQSFKRIGLAYTAHSTSAVSKQLLHSRAKLYGKTIDIIDCDCTQYWSLFESGDLVGYEQGIANTIKTIEADVDIVFLAQASMEGATDYLKQANLNQAKDVSKPVLSSPDFGIKTLLKWL